MKATLANLMLAGIALATTSASAVTLNPKGLGQVLIYPYYTVNKGQDTLVSVINTSDLGSVVKVRFDEGINGRWVLDFNLFLSPQDVWTARISQTADDAGAALFTNDHSCTYPPIPASGVSFRASAYAGGSIFPADGGPTSATRTREGMIEMIEMGSVIPGSDLDDQITHVQNGQPNAGIPGCDLSVIGNYAGQFLELSQGGLGGSASIVDVGEGTFFSYGADALAGFTDQLLFSGSSNVFPFLYQANSRDSSYVAGAVAHIIANNGDLLSLDYANGIDAVSAVFMADAIDNEYLTAASLGANTDWVVTFPTKAFYVDPFYTENRAIPPFVELFHAPGASNIEALDELYDQEEGFRFPSSGGGLPPINDAFVLGYQVNVISFFDPTNFLGNPPRPGVLGSSLRSFVPPYGDAGYMSLRLADGDGIGHAMRPAANGSILHGLPVTGFMVYNIINANAAPGRLANYGGTFAHRSTLRCSQSATDSRDCAQ